LGANGKWIGVVRDVEVRAKNHPGSGENVGIVSPQTARLLNGAFGTCDHVLLFDGLDPEARGEVSEVGDDGDERATRIDLGPAFGDLAVEVGDHGNEQIGGFLAPEILEQADHGAMKDLDGELQQAQQKYGAQRPAVLEQFVVLLLDADTGEASQDVEVVGELLKLHELDLPGALLLFDNRLQSGGGVAVTTTCVMKK